MNPLLYLFNSLKDLSSETELLEACDWCEERAEYVKSEMERCLKEVIDSKDIMGKESLVESLRKLLICNISEKECDVCILILEKTFQSLSLAKGDNYEN